MSECDKPKHKLIKTTKIPSLSIYKASNKGKLKNLCHHWISWANSILKSESVAEVLISVNNSLLICAKPLHFNKAISIHSIPQYQILKTKVTLSLCINQLFLTSIKIRMPSSQKTLKSRNRCIITMVGYLRLRAYRFTRKIGKMGKVNIKKRKPTKTFKIYMKIQKAISFPSPKKFNIKSEAWFLPWHQMEPLNQFLKEKIKLNNFTPP